MTLSELITELEEVKKKHGDLELVKDTSDGSYNDWDKVRYINAMPIRLKLNSFSSFDFVEYGKNPNFLEISL